MERSSLLAQSPYLLDNGFELVTLEDGRAVIECVVQPRHANSQGMAHGGMISALADTAAGAAVVYQPSTDGRAGATASLTVSFLRPATVGDRLRAEGLRRSDGKRVVGCTVEVTGAGGSLIATAQCTVALRSGSSAPA